MKECERFGDRLEMESERGKDKTNLAEYELISLYVVHFTEEPCNIESLEVGFIIFKIIRKFSHAIDTILTILVIFHAMKRNFGTTPGIRCHGK